MFALTLNGTRNFPLYTTKEAAQTMLEFLNTYGDGQGRKGYIMTEV